MKYLPKMSGNKINRKKDRDKRLIKNLRPMSLLNTDIKLISKALATRLKDKLSDLISSNQTGHMKNRCISESGKLIYDALKTASIKWERVPSNSRYRKSFWLGCSFAFISCFAEVWFGETFSKMNSNSN